MYCSPTYICKTHAYLVNGIRQHDVVSTESGRNARFCEFLANEKLSLGGACCRETLGIYD